MPETLLIRADAGPEIGIGHVMRCLALAQAWQVQGGAAVFALASAPRDLGERLGAEGFAMGSIKGRAGHADDARETAALARGCSAGCVVLDGYQFDADYRRTLGRLDARLLLVVDGVGAGAAGADVVLDQNLGASQAELSGEGSRTRFLLGPRYALLRREFWRWRGWRHEIVRPAQRVLVTFGGGDFDNLALRALQALRLLPEASALEVRVVVGPANRHRASLENELLMAPAGWVLVTAPADMSALIAWADLCISAAGSTCWELAFLGSPFVTIVLAENQRAIAADLSRAGLSKNLGWHEGVSAERLSESIGELLDDVASRTEMSRLGQETVDGFGAERVASVLSRVAA
ncbi:MAG: UDP-2,4-diacetamido-2,4,6-trideoxy-beta-L-altropyranose hydrolase [Thermoanaerobaculia bacterium]